jgi:hypothetical protein
MVGFVFIAILFAAVVALGLVSVVARSCTLPRGMSAAPVCGRCRYPAGAGERCPECGGAYREVGLLTPWLAMRSRPGVVSAGACLAVLCISLAGLVLAFVDPIVRTNVSTSETVWARYALGGTVAPYSLVVSARRDRSAFGVFTAGEARFLLVRPDEPVGTDPPPRQTPALVVRLGEPLVRVIDARETIVHRGPIEDAEAVRRLFAVSGLDPGAPPANEHTATQIAALAAVILGRGWPSDLGEAIPGPPGGLSLTSVRESFTMRPLMIAGVPAPVAATVMIALSALLLFVVMMRRVARRRRRLLTPPASPPASAA